MQLSSLCCSSDATLITRALFQRAARLHGQQLRGGRHRHRLGPHRRRHLQLRALVHNDNCHGVLLRHGRNDVMDCCALVDLAATCSYDAPKSDCPVVIAVHRNASDPTLTKSCCDYFAYVFSLVFFICWCWYTTRRMFYVVNPWLMTSCAIRAHTILEENCCDRVVLITGPWNETKGWLQYYRHRLLVNTSVAQTKRPQIVKSYVFGQDKMWCG